MAVTTISDAGLVYRQWPITAVRIHRVDNQWLVEYRRKPKWFFDKWWWFNDGKYVEYLDARSRAEKLSRQKFVMLLNYRDAEYVEVVHDDV